jgi:hypothetical protein
MNHLTATLAAKMLECSRSSVCRAAKASGTGIYANGRLVAIPENQLNKIKPFIHETAGNPDWIAAKKRRKPARRGV